MSAQSGPVFSKTFAARGLAIGDFNNDGAVDVLISNNDGPPVLLRNNAGRQNHWLGLHLVGSKSNPDAIGARITYQAGDLKRERMKVGGGSFLSSHDPRMVLGTRQAHDNRLAGNQVAPARRKRRAFYETARSIATSQLSKERVDGSRPNPHQAITKLKAIRGPLA